MAAPEPSLPLRVAIAALSTGESLGRERARVVMEAILAGAATPAQIGALLMGLRLHGESPEDIAGFVEAMRAAAVKLELTSDDAVDLCGTGGDGAGTINISTGAALVAAAAGARVAKHGNRSASGRAGSADVLEAMGIPIDLPPDRTRASIEELNFGFLFAPSYHPAMRHAAAPRRELGIRTVFNVLGPLTNPAGVRRQLLGVYEDRLRRPVAEALLALGSDRVWVVHSPAPDGGGLDEIGLAGLTRVTALEGGKLRELEIAPEEAGLERRRKPDLSGGDASLNARRLEEVISGEPGPCRDAVVLNAAAALVIAGRAGNLLEAAAAAAESIDSGRVRSLLELLRRRR